MLHRLRVVSESHSPQPPQPPCGCDRDPVTALKEMFVDFAQGLSLAAGRDPATRPVFLRLHGVAHGTFKVVEGLPKELRVGVFGQREEYPVWVRFSSDLQPGNPDLKGTIGIGIKVFGVTGRKLLTPDQDAATHDFLLQNHDVFFVDTALDMCEFTCLSLNRRFQEYIERHPVTGQVLRDMEKVVDSALGTPYWSGLPSRFGEGRYVKYKLEPEQVPPGNPPDYDDPFYLRADLHRRLAAGEARFRFLIQFQTDEHAMPLDRATVRWSEQASPPVHVATLVLPRQDLDTRGQSAYGENLAFNPWYALPEHEPAGSIAAARKVVYRASADVRRDFNAVPRGEPSAPRPAEWQPGVPYPPPRDTTVVRAAIHPAIGVARVGTSTSEYFVGPEVTDPDPAPPRFYRDATGALKRQAAQFRLYGYNAAGEVVRELTPDWAAVRWTVHVANQKAAWYQWTMALDVPEAAGSTIPRRNATVQGARRRELIIDGGPRSIQGRNTSGAGYEFRGSFQGTSVYLGELRTDDQGRLLFLGGRGQSASPTGTPIFPPGPNGFINADGWYDDTSDGPVTAEVTIEGRPIPVTPAWVVTAPPDYGPSLVGVRTLYDLLFDLYVQEGWLPFPARVTFREHVYPILQRLSRLQWVNRGFATQFGRTGPNDFENPGYVAKLAPNPPSAGIDLYGELRRQVLNSFRDPAGQDPSRLPWPWLYGDVDGVPNSPRLNAAVSPTQYHMLRLWAAARLDPDPNPAPAVPRTLDQLPVRDQPAMLDRAALQFCLADAFHPGCEVTWPIRHLTLFSAPFRIRHRPPDTPESDYGDTLTPEIALSHSGPLHAQGPGGLTRWMGLPWQADTAYCRSGYEREYDPYLPTFWPARVPNQVLTEPNYQVVINAQEARARRLAAFTDRMVWTRPLHGTPSQQMEQMVGVFGDMGLVEVRPGVANDPDFPPQMLVASFGPAVSPPPPPPRAVAAMPAPSPVEDPQETLRRRAIQEAGWESEEQAAQAPRPVHPPR